MFKQVAMLALAFVGSAAFGSEPGQPLDCSDFVFHQPGFSCSEGPDSLGPWKGSNLAADNSGRMLTLASYFGSGTIRVQVSDPQGGFTLGEISRRQLPNGTADHIGTQQTGCALHGNWPQCDGDYTVNGLTDALWFDAVNGILTFSAMAYCVEPAEPRGSHMCAYGTYPYPTPGLSVVNRVFRISGFARLIDIFQSYQPATGPLSFRVPAMPDGLAGADHFDTYWGELATVGDWSKAKGLQCNYPAAAPSVGDYVEVPDTVPTPAPGHGVYYVTAATYQGVTRYGRKATAGRLSGRDPALLPLCNDAQTGSRVSARQPGKRVDEFLGASGSRN